MNTDCEAPHQAGSLPASCQFLPLGYKYTSQLLVFKLSHSDYSLTYELTQMKISSLWKIIAQLWEH
jgi:hypothetical protein